MECSGEGKYGYWMPDLGQFSRVQDPDHDLLEDGDLSPWVCESCRDRMASGPHWDGDRFINPREKLVADGGFELGVDRPPEPPEVDRPSWVCPGCNVCYDGRPEIVTEDPLECYCSEECYNRSLHTGTDRSGGER